MRMLILTIFVYLSFPATILAQEGFYFAYERRFMCEVPSVFNVLDPEEASKEELMTLRQRVLEEPGCTQIGERVARVQNPNATRLIVPYETQVEMVPGGMKRVTITPSKKRMFILYFKLVVGEGTDL